jgi:hypothetical protein
VATRYPEQKAVSLATIVFLGFVSATIWAYGWLHWIGAPFPRGTFLFHPRASFADLFDILGALASGNPYAQEVSVYPPAAYLPLLPLLGLGQVGALVALLATFFAASLAFALQALRSLPRASRVLAATALAFASYPMLFCADRANLEILAYVALGLFLICLRRSRPGLGAFFLGWAVAIKIFPGVFVALIIARGKGRARFAYAAAALGWALALTLVGALALRAPGGLPAIWGGFTHNLANFRLHYAMDDQKLPFGTGLLGFIEVCLRARAPEPALWIERARQMYPYLALALLVGVLCRVLRVERTLWRQVAWLAFALVLLPEVSFDYRLVYLLFPLLLFVAEEDRGPNDRLYLAGFGLLMIPKAYVWIGGQCNIGVLLNPLLMIGMSSVMMSEKRVS